MDSLNNKKKKKKQHERRTSRFVFLFPKVGQTEISWLSFTCFGSAGSACKHWHTDLLALYYLCCARARACVLVRVCVSAPAWHSGSLVRACSGDVTSFSAEYLNTLPSHRRRSVFLTSCVHLVLVSHTLSHTLTHSFYITHTHAQSFAVLKPMARSFTQKKFWESSNYFDCFEFEALFRATDKLWIKFAKLDDQLHSHSFSLKQHYENFIPISKCYEIYYSIKLQSFIRLRLLQPVKMIINSSSSYFTVVWYLN